MNKAMGVQAMRKANDEAFFGWLMKLVEFGVIAAGGMAVARGSLKIGTFTAVHKALTSATKEFQTVFTTMMAMETSYPGLWKIVEYMNGPTDLLRRRDMVKQRQDELEELVKTVGTTDPKAVVEDNVPIYMKDVTFCYRARE